MTSGPAEGYRLIEQTEMRRAIGRRMSDSKRDVPHFYVTAPIEVDHALAALGSLNDAASPKRISVTALLAHGCARALARHEGLNAVWTSEGLAAVDSVNVAVAIATDGGVIAPALVGADRLNLADTATALDDLVARARSNRLRGSELNDGTFTLSNLGMYAVSRFAAIVTPPQVAVLATGAITRMPSMSSAGFSERAVIEATISADHRAVDGVDAARFLQTLKELIEEHPVG